MTLLEENTAFTQAERGRELAVQLRNTYAADERTCWIILPDDDEELWEAATENLPSYMESKCFSHALILGCRSCFTELHCERGTIHYIACTQDDLEAILAYYRLVPFAETVVVSLKEPYALPGWIGHFGITVRDYVRDALFFGKPVSWMTWKTDRAGILQDLQKQMDKLTGRNIYIYGWTNYAVKIAEGLQKCGLKPAGMVDSDPDKEGWNSALSISCRTPEHALLPYDSNAAVIIVSKYGREMRRKLLSLGYPEAQTVTVSVQKDTSSLMDMDKETLLNEYGIARTGLDLRNSISAQFIVPCIGGTGDVYWLCALLKSYLEENNIHDYALILDEKRIRAASAVAALFGIERIITLTVEQLSSLYKAWEFYGSEQMHMKPDLHIGSRLARNINPPKENGHYPLWRNHLNSMRYQYFHDRTIKTLYEPVQRDPGAGVYEAYGIRKGRTVILSPYAAAGQSTLANTDFWTRLAAALQERGLTVFTNCAGNEQPIEGTRAVCPAYSELIPFLNHAGCLIAVRSGLCDIAATARRCRILLIYEKGNGVIPDTFSLKRMGIHPDSEDFLYSGNTDTLLSQILSHIS